jgi:hypothetical protein
MELIFGGRVVTSGAYPSIYIVISSSNMYYTPFAYRYSYGALGLLVRQEGCVGKYAHTHTHTTSRAYNKPS